MKKPIPIVNYALTFMKITVLQILIAVGLSGLTIASPEDSYGQGILDNTLSISAENKKLGDILSRIEKLVHVKFSFNPKTIPLKEKVSVNLQDAKLKDVLGDLLEPLRINYEVSGDYVILSKPLITASADLNDSLNKMRMEVYALSVSGTVVDENSQTLPGVNVIEKGTTNGTTTDADGKFSLTVQNENSVLVFSFIGYSSQELAVDRRSVIDVALVEDVKKLDEVVVVGYGTQKKTTITGSVSSVKGDDVARIPVANISNSIAGRLAGVSMRPNGGQPGKDNPDIYIRGIATSGSHNPLIVVDGIIRNNINQIDPTIIESISVLKDAAAVAPYGLGGANGVILITTRKGQLGAPTLTLNSYYGWQSPTSFPKLLDAKDYMRLSNESYMNENPGLTMIPYAKDMIANYDALNKENPDLYPNSSTTDLINMTTPIQKYDLQLSGGSESMKYFIGMGYFKQDGMFDAVNYSRVNLNMNVESKVNNTTTVSLAILGSVERTNDLDFASSANRLFRTGFRYKPIVPVYFTNGLWTQTANSSYVAVLNSKGYNKNDGNTILSTIAIEKELPFIKGFSVKGTVSYDTRYSFVKGWHEPFYYWSQNTNTIPYTYIKSSTGLEGDVPYTYLIQTQTQKKYFTYQGFVNYHRSFGLHDFTGLLVAEARNNTYDTLYAQRNNFAILIDEMSMGSSAKNDYDNGGSSSVGSQIGYVYRVGYVYNNKYMLEASGRYDGHYYFAPGKRWGYFPAFSAGWGISEENFIKSLKAVDNLKIRASWGKSGNLAGSAYQYLSGYTLAGNAYAFGGGTMVPGAYQAQESNPNITWEISTKADIGFEASLWNSLLMVEADYFHEHRTGMLLAPAVSVPLEYGLNLAQENVGEIKNQGFELTIGSRKELQNGLKLGLDANFSVAKNKMVQIFETGATFNNPNRSRTSKAFGTPFGYRSLGLFSSADDKNNDGIIDLSEYPVTQFGVLHPGDVKYQDISGPNGDMIPDGKIDGNDEVAIGYPHYPLMSFGFITTAEWKGFDLSLFFQGSAMASINIYNFQTVPFYNSLSNSDYEYFNDHWTVDNQNATYPRSTSSPYPNNAQVSDFWMRDLNFLRLKTGTFGYTLPTSVVTNFVSIKSVRVYCSVQNILTFSKLKFMDPEMGYTFNVTSYPNMKSFSFGVNVTL